MKLITYSEVFKQVEDELSSQLETKGKSQKRVDNFRTSRNGWMRQFGLSEESLVGIEFGSGFGDSLERYSKTLVDEGKASQTIADRRSMMGAYREAWVSILQSATANLLEGDFAQAIDQLIELSGISVATIARNSGVGETTFDKWRKGQSLPSKRALPTVHRLEDIFGLPCGMLAAKLPKVLFGDSGLVRTGLTGYRKHVSEVMKHQYLLKDFPLRLQSEWDKVFLFYTDAAWLKTRGLKRNSKWRVREHDNRCPSAERARGYVSEFMGYLCLNAGEDGPHGKGKRFMPEELTLALLTDSNLIYSFLHFKKERTYLNSYNSATFTFLHFCLTLLRPETGFLWQSPELGVRLPVPVPAVDWREWCRRHRSVIESTVKDLVRENEFKKTRDPFEPIRAIITNNQHPLDVLFELADAYEADAPPRHASPQSKAIHYQNLFLIKFLTLIPLRAFNLSVMAWRPDDTGNLYRKQDGSWWVRFDHSYLKNHKSSAKGRPFDVPLHPSLWSYVEKFIFVHRPHLTGVDECDYVFRPGVTRKVTKIKNAGREVYGWFLSRRVFKITQRYIPNCPGFGVQAFRHLVATEYIKNNPAGYAVAAAILHDKEETVRKNYAWVLPADKFNFWNDYVGALLKNREEEEASDGAGVRA